MFSETFFADVTLEAGCRLSMPDDHEDRGIYIVEGSISVAGQAYEASQMTVFGPGDRITVAAGGQGARLMILGGATFGGPRYIWWNFVASSKDRIEESKAEWRAEDRGKGCFDLPVDDRDEHIHCQTDRRKEGGRLGTEPDGSGEMTRRVPGMF